MAFAVYRETELLIDQLNKESLAPYGDLLHQAMREGATGTEIFMALSWHLGRMPSNKGASITAREQMRKIKEEIDRHI